VSAQQIDAFQTAIELSRSEKSTLWRAELLRRLTACISFGVLIKRFPSYKVEYSYHQCSYFI